MEAAILAQRLAAWCGLWEREALRRKARVQVSRARTSLVREVCARWGALAKNVGEKMGRGGRERFAAVVSHFAVDPNLARPVARRGARARHRRVARDPWGSGKLAGLWRRLRLPENFRVFGGDSGGLLLPNFPARNFFQH